VTINGFSQPEATPNTLAVGTNANLLIELDGSKATANSALGLCITASDSTVKGLVINSFNYSGIDIRNTTADGNRIEGNFIGTDPSGIQDLGNGDDGITIGSGSDSNTVGGTSRALRNLISGNTDGGVYIESGNQVRGNLIGTKKDGTTALGNGINGGVWVEESSSIVAGNTIAFNVGAGVVVAVGNGDRVLSIFSNGGLGIDLGDDGVTANDPGDTDTGANALQNKPVIRSATTGGGTTTVGARLNSTPNKSFTVQFFSNPSGNNEGKTFIGQKSVTTNGSGDATFVFSPAQNVGLGRTITATATDAAGNTSEFSAPRTVLSS
jgi:hypothetical protein